MERQSDNASILTTICIDHKLFVVNNLKSGDNCYEGALTYRAGTQWISELDVCAISYRNLECVKGFNVLNDVMNE